MPIVPTRFGKQSFARYAPILMRALKAYPGAVVVESNMSAENMAQRIRDCITAKRHYNYPLPDHEDLFTAHAHDLSVSVRPEGIVIGPLKAIRNDMLVRDKPTNEVTFKGNGALLTSLVAMQSSRSFEPPISFVVSCDKETITSLESAYDVVFVPIPGEADKYLLL